MKKNPLLPSLALLACFSLPLTVNAQSDLIGALNGTGILTQLPIPPVLKLVTGELLPLTTSLLAGSPLLEQGAGALGNITTPLLNTSDQLSQLTVITDVTSILPLPGF
ncbi:MAG: hypothetical protein ACSHWQ_01370 [Spongiibacteraceae bacterium]